MNISLVTIVCVIYAILVGATEANIDECTYVFLYNPVCGNDGVTYVNSGHLNCEKLKRPALRQLREGECPEGGAIIQDGRLGDNGDDDSKENKIKIKFKKGPSHHSNIKISAHVAKAIAKSLHKSQGSTHRSGGGGRRSGGGRRGRRRRSAEEMYDVNDVDEAYPEYDYSEYSYIEDLPSTEK